MGSRSMIIDHTAPEYVELRERLNNGKYNGAYYYSCEIVKNIIPNIKTDRNWITVKIQGKACDHAIVFVHNNKQPENYEWLSAYKDLVFVCGVPETCDKLKHLGKVIYLPLSIDVEEVKRYKAKKTKDTAYAGREPKRGPEYVAGLELPEGVPCLESMPREKLLTEMAQYKNIYAVGRTALEAKVLGCNVLDYDPRYPNPDAWQVLDNKDAVKILQRELDKIDGSGPVVIDHTDPEYEEARRRIGPQKYNGAYYYSREICENIIPNVKTDRNWITIKAGEKAVPHSICFVHNNVTFEKQYAYLRKYPDVVYVVGLPDMVERAEKFGKTIYLPLSVDVDYVKRFKTKKTKDTACVGRPASRWGKEFSLPAGIDYIEKLPRDEYLAELAKYKNVYAIGRTAIEAKILGCKVLPFHPRLMDVDLWKVLDNKAAAVLLQEALDQIDKPKKKRTRKAKASTKADKAGAQAKRASTKAKKASTKRKPASTQKRAKGR